MTFAVFRSLVFQHRLPRKTMLFPFLECSFTPFLRRYSPPTILDADEIGRTTTSSLLLSVKRFLRQHGYGFTDLGYSSLILVLPKHALESTVDPPSKWKQIDSSLCEVFVDKRTARFSCPELDIYGDWKRLKDFLTQLQKSRSSSSSSSSSKIKSLPSTDFRFSDTDRFFSESIPIQDLDSQRFKHILKSLKMPSAKLKPSDFAKFEVRVDKINALLFPVRLKPSDMVVGIRRIRALSDDSILEENLFDSNPNEHRLLPFLHGIDQIRHGKNNVIVLVSSVLDSIVLKSVSDSCVPIAVAEGTQNLPPEHLPFLERISRIQIWFPNSDSRSLDHAMLFAKKLGTKRCEIMSREFSNPWNCLKLRNFDIKRAWKEAMRPCSHDYITTFDHLREGVYLEFLNIAKCEGIKWKRFESLNEYLKGFRRGELTVFSGRTGSGKTTFISEYSLDLCDQGVNTLWGSFEVNNTRLVKMQLKQFSQIHFESEGMDEFDAWADRFQKLQMYYLTFHGSNDVRLVLDAMLHAAYVYDIGHIIIDNIQFMMGSTAFRGGGDKFTQQDIIIEQFRKFATVHNVHVTLVIHPRKDADDLLTTNSIFGGAKATQEADNVILLQTETTNVHNKQKKYLQIVKNRFSGDLGIVPLFFNKGTLTFNKKTYLRNHSRNKPKVPGK